METQRLRLYFKDDTNHAKSITIDYPKDTYTAEEITTAMDSIITSGVLATKYGPIATRQKAEKETITKQAYDIA